MGKIADWFWEGVTVQHTDEISVKKVHIFAHSMCLLIETFFLVLTTLAMCHLLPDIEVNGHFIWIGCVNLLAWIISATTILTVKTDIKKIMKNGG